MIAKKYELIAIHLRYISQDAVIDKRGQLLRSKHSFLNKMTKLKDKGAILDRLKDACELIEDGYQVTTLQQSKYKKDL